MTLTWRKSAHSNPSQNCVELAHVWRKSSFSGGDNGSQCVEVAPCLHATLVRDSKNPTGPGLRLPGGALAGLVALAQEL